MLKKWLTTIQNWLKRELARPHIERQCGEGNHYRDIARERREEIQYSPYRYRSFRL